ncbi:hypothetical protein [Haloarcula salina]|uniref:DUF8151 domain-containing protein n=1 Tax=Haloarcula salina TaxID=1429914 RepID=A0AA41FX94_9EURY|nr:hypothetical protein [Haloarcula salina]MBV0900482.1 hypothetical protein [Haloarcula salina]
MVGSESLPEVLELVLSALLATAFTAGGALTEQAALSDLSAGVSAFGLWELYMGLVLLYAGVYMLGYQRVLPAVGRIAA